jgi:hypothetical protein
MLRNFIHITLGFILGIAGNLIAGWIQQDFWDGLFTPNRLFLTVLVMLLTILLLSWLDNASPSASVSHGETNLPMPENTMIKKTPIDNDVNNPNFLKNLLEPYDESDLRGLCFYHFPEVKIGAKMVKEEINIELIGYCIRNKKVDQLLAKIKDDKPEHYNSLISDVQQSSSKVPNNLINIFIAVLVVGVIYWVTNQEEVPAALTRVGTASQFSENITEIYTFAGEWQTNFAYMTLAEVGNQITGSYIRYSRSQPTKLTGVVANRILTGSNEATTNFNLTLSNDGQSFHGTWTSNNDGRAYPWCGVRKGALLAGCGFSGRWLSNQSADSWVELEQIGDQVNGRYFNGAYNGRLTGHFEIADDQYNLVGEFEDDNGDHGIFRFILLDLGNEQFQGCFRNQSTGLQQISSDWCGWREDSFQPLQCNPQPKENCQ